MPSKWSNLKNRAMLIAFALTVFISLGCAFIGDPPPGPTWTQWNGSKINKTSAMQTHAPSWGQRAQRTVVHVRLIELLPDAPVCRKFAQESCSPCERKVLREGQAGKGSRTNTEAEFGTYFCRIMCTCVCVWFQVFFYVLLSASLTETTIESVEGIVWGVWEAGPVLPFMLLHTGIVPVEGT